MSTQYPTKQAATAAIRPRVLHHIMMMEAIT
jgi:hypothetical protein